jgi:D-alanine-D-alanine ligase
MSHLQVAVLRGGPSVEFSVSMKTGAAVLEALAENGFQTKDIVITKQGDWLDRGFTRTPDQALQAIDVVFVALHGTYGEDGEVQKILQRLNIPFTGSRSFASAVAFNKELTKKHLADFDILLPRSTEVTADETINLGEVAERIRADFGPEYIIKPVASGSSFGIEHVPLGKSLEDSLAAALKANDRVMVEEFIRGKEATCATLEDFRNEKIYVFPSVEIVPPNDVQFFDTDSKYSGKTLEICPSRFSYADRIKIADASALVHEALNLAQYSRSDFIVSDNGIYFLEVNTLPGLTSESLYPKAAAAVGLDLKGLVRHLVETATC